MSRVRRAHGPPIARTDGRSWKRLVTSGDPSWRTEWLSTYDYEKQFPYMPNIRGIRTERFTFMRCLHGDAGADRHRPEMYDLEVDPEETRNLAADPAHAAGPADPLGPCAGQGGATGSPVRPDVRGPIDGFPGAPPRLPPSRRTGGASG